MAAIFTVISNILATIDFINLFRDLGANDAGASITLEDIGRIVRAELSTFFRDLQVSDLRTTHSSFYRAWLPSITARSSITANDITSNTGVLNRTFNDLIAGIALTQRNLDRLETIYIRDSHLFHVDDVVQGVFLFTEMFGLLFHMHSAYATLRRISMRAATLNDPALLLDTLNVRTYTRNAIRVINWMRTRANDRRFNTDLFTPVLERWTSNTTYRRRNWYYDDRYRSLNTTPQRNRIDVGSPPAWHDENVIRESSAVVRQRVEALREQRRINLLSRFVSLVTMPYSQVVRDLEQFDRRMATREALQRQASRRSAAFSESQFATLMSSNEKPEGDTDIENETALVVTADVDEYRQLTELIYFTTTGEESLEGEADVDIPVTHSTEFAHTCPHCNSVLKTPTAADVAVGA